MHKNQFRFVWGLLIALMLPAMAMAAPPPPATGISATVEDGAVRVTWDAFPDQARAKVYWSYLSILENGGEYDDFAVIEGSDNEYVIDSPPEVETLYVAVILENADGEQSPFFTEEASVTFEEEPAEEEPVEEEPAGEASSSSEPEQPMESSSSAEAVSSAFVAASIDTALFASSSSSAMPTDGTFHLLGAESVSPTQVVLAFSHSVAIRPEDAASAFMIRTQDGRQLSLVRLEILGPRVTVTTDTQERGVRYVATAGPVVFGAQGQTALPLAGGTETASFEGNALGKDPVPFVAPQGGLTLQASALGGNLFRVEASLGGLPREGVARYDVFQSIDGGRTFMGPQSVSPQVPSVRVDGVPGGAFVMMLQPVMLDGSKGLPLTATAMLGAGLPAPSSITWQQPKSQASSRSASPSTSLPSPALPGSGAGIVTLLGAGSGWAMARRMRRKAAGSVKA